MSTRAYLAELPVRAVGALARALPPRIRLGFYRNRTLAGAVRAAINRVVAPGLHPVEIAAGPLKGARMELDLRREKFLWLGTYEPWVQEALTAHLGPGDSAWDVGGYVGYHTLLMSRVSGPGQVVVLEPERGSRERLVTNLRLNAAKNVVVLPVAAGSRGGWGGLRRGVENPAMTEVLPGAGTDCEIVTLDELLTRFAPPTLVKLDVEGAEADVLAGASRLVEGTRPVWVVELHDRGEQPITAAFEAADYRVYSIGKGVDSRDDLPVGGPKHVVAVPSPRGVV